MRCSRSGAQRTPCRVRYDSRLAVCTSQHDGGSRPPEHVVVLGVETRDHRITAADVRQREHARRLHEIQAAIGGKAQPPLVPLTQVVIGPEQGTVRLLIGSDVAVESAEPPDLLQVSSIFLTAQPTRSGWAKFLPCEDWFSEFEAKWLYHCTIDLPSITVEIYEHLPALPSLETGSRRTRSARTMLGVRVYGTGVEHFGYAFKETSNMVPGWIPGGRRFWAAATGVAHLAAGAAILSGVLGSLDRGYWW